MGWCSVGLVCLGGLGGGWCRVCFGFVKGGFSLGLVLLYGGLGIGFGVALESYRICLVGVV